MEVVFENSLTPSNYKLSLTFFFIITGLLVFTIFALIFSDSETASPSVASIPESPVNENQPSPVNEPTYTPPPIPAQVSVTKETVEKSPEPAFKDDITDEGKPIDTPVKGTGIYSEKSGFVRSELLVDKLNQELKRSASFDQDLVLVIFSLKGMKDSKMGNLQKIVNESFPYKDLVFEYGPSSFAIIIPNIDLESGSTDIESFQLKLEKTSVVEGLSAGISSRSGRLLTGDRLLLEASSSHKRAASDKNGGIILFRISPRKYRQVISEKAF